MTAFASPLRARTAEVAPMTATASRVARRLGVIAVAPMSTVRIRDVRAMETSAVMEPPTSSMPMATVTPVTLTVTMPIQR